MDAETARKESLKNQKKNKELQKSIEYTDNAMKQAMEKGERECVLHNTKYDILPTLIAHYEEKGFKVGQFKPPQITHYVRW